MVESAPGQGTAFTAYLPMSGAAEAQDPAPQVATGLS